MPDHVLTAGGVELHEIGPERSQLFEERIRDVPEEGDVARVLVVPKERKRGPGAVGLLVAW